MKTRHIVKVIVVFIFIFLTKDIIYSQCWPWYSGIYEHVYAVKKNSTGTGYTEVHILNRNSWYQNFLLQVPTPIEQTWDNRYQFTVTDFSQWWWGRPGLFAIKKWGTGSGKTEVHVLSPPYFDHFDLQVPTVLDETNDNYYFLAGKFGNYCDAGNSTDLWVLKKANTRSGNVELTILDGESNFQNVVVTQTLPIQIGIYEWQFGLGRYMQNDYTYLYVFRLWNYASDLPQQLKIIIFSCGDLQNPVAQIYTPFYVYGPDQVQVSPAVQIFNGQQRLSDVVVVRKNGSGSHKTEVHLLDRLNMYQSFVFQVTTPIEENYSNFEFSAAHWLDWYDDSSKASNNNELKQNENSDFNSKIYPNPFNPVTKIHFNLPYSAEVRLKIFNSVGQEVAELLNQYMEKGEYQVNFDGSNLPSGVYFYSIWEKNNIHTGRMLLLK